MNAANAPAARSAARRFAERFQAQYPAAVACLRNDLDELGHLLPLQIRSRTSCRAHDQCRRAAFPRGQATHQTDGYFQDKTSMDRILFAVFTHENKSQGVSTPFLLTQSKDLDDGVIDEEKQFALALRGWIEK
jgi:hypothetical protein